MNVGRAVIGWVAALALALVVVIVAASILFGS